METLPNIGEILGRVIGRIAAEHRPLFIALAERLAAARYREWARVVPDPARAPLLIQCAEREEDIATRVESLFPDARTIQNEIRAAIPELDDLNRSIFADRPLRQQFTIQAEGERIGAATWRSLAPADASAPARAVFLRCAELEEESALVLESMLRDGA